MRFRPDWVTPCAALPRGLPETVSHQTAAKSGSGGLTALRTADPRRAVTGAPLLRIGSVNRLICHLSNFSNTFTFGLRPRRQEIGRSMSQIRNRIAIAVGAGAGLCSALLALSPTAAADPALPTIPGLPGLVQQIAASPASVPQLLQSAASALAGVPAAPAQAAPAASAAISLPQPATPAPAATAAVALPQPATPVPAAVAATAPGQLVPSAQLDLPTVPGLPLSLPSQLSLPGALASLVPGGIPMPNLGAKPAAAAVTPAAALPGAVAPAAVAPGRTGLEGLFPVSALP